MKKNLSPNNQTRTRRTVDLRRRRKTKKKSPPRNKNSTRRQKAGAEDDEARRSAGALPDAHAPHATNFQAWRRLEEENGRCPYCLRSGSICYQGWGLAWGSVLPITTNTKYIIKCANTDDGGCGRFICCA